MVAGNDTEHQKDYWSRHRWNGGMGGVVPGDQIAA
jgi:hypothetical protein